MAELYAAPMLTMIASEMPAFMPMKSMIICWRVTSKSECALRVFSAEEKWPSIPKQSHWPVLCNSSRRWYFACHCTKNSRNYLRKRIMTALPLWFLWCLQSNWKSLWNEGVLELHGWNLGKSRVSHFNSKAYNIMKCEMYIILPLPKNKCHHIKHDKVRIVCLDYQILKYLIKATPYFILIKDSVYTYVNNVTLP